MTLSRFLSPFLFVMVICAAGSPVRAQSDFPVAGRDYRIGYTPPPGVFAAAAQLRAVYVFNFWGRRTGTRLALRANVLSPDTARVHAVELTRRGQRWEAEIAIPPNAAVLSYYVTDGQTKDLNNDKTYVTLVHDSLGAVVPNAHFFMVPFVKLAGAPLDAQINEAREEILRYPENFRAYYQYYQLRLEWGRNGSSTREAISSELQALGAKYGDNIDFRNLTARTFYYLLKDVKTGLGFRNTIPPDKQYADVLMMYDREAAEKQREEVTQKAALTQMTMMDKPAPPFRLDAHRGSPVSLEDYRDKVLLVGFWASWSKSCKEQIPALTRLSAELAPRGFSYIAVNLDAKRDVVDKFLKSTPVEAPILYGNSSVQQAYGVGPVPHLVLIDRKGLVKKVFVGYTPGDENNYRAAIEALLGS